MNKLFCFGYGYTARHVAAQLRERGSWSIAGTTQSGEKLHAMEQEGVHGYILYDHDPNIMLGGTTHILISIPPSSEGCPVFQECRAAIQTLPNLKWLGYCSSTAVYGDAGGAWVNESTPPAPKSERGKWRLLAEEQWLGLAHDLHIPTHIFRISGIYGPERSALESLQKYAARRIKKDNHFFSRIHVHDIAQSIIASIHAPQTGEIYNLADDAPSEGHEVIEYAAELLSITPPDIEHYHEAELSDMLRSFYESNKKVSNNKIKDQLGVELAYPDYKAGLRAVLKEIKT